MKKKRINELLNDKDTLADLISIGHMRNKIWFMHREVSKMERIIGDAERKLQDKHDLTFPEFIGLSIMADGTFEAYLKDKKKKEKK